MSNSTINEFIKLCKEDPELKSIILQSDQESFIKEAASRGFTISADDLNAQIGDEKSDSELSKEELTSVAGGAKAAAGYWTNTIRSAFSGESGCCYWGVSSKGSIDSNPTFKRR